MQAPLSRHTPQRAETARLDWNSHLCHRTLDRVRNHDLIRTSRRHDPRGCPDGETANLFASHLAHTPVDTKSARKAQCSQCRRQRHRTSDSLDRVNEGREETIARNVHLRATEALQLAPYAGSVVVQLLAPASVPRLR